LQKALIDLGDASQRLKDALGALVVCSGLQN
jgi:hypothetical protein